jgi:hypothetical protein
MSVVAKIPCLELRAKKGGHQTSVNFEKFDVVQALLSFCLIIVIKI